MKKENISCRSARNFCLVKLLEKLGHFPTRKTEKEAWFLSPFRSETQASFKISLALNRWYDHGMGKGGNSIDLVMQLKNFTVKETLDFISGNNISFFQKPGTNIKKKDNIEIISIRTIKHIALIEYLRSRKIPLDIARQFLNEIYYKSNGYRFFGLGLKNHLGGWELRNKFYKSSSSPKMYTYFNSNQKTLLVFEGMFDFLSMATINPLLIYQSDSIILNSISFIAHIEEHIPKYEQTFLYLDNDPSGNLATSSLLIKYSAVSDERNLYSNYTDLNQKLCHG
tara:strand:- start:6790 stop:7635 length:846 start_codon:yes stop_codon:yes gene_type:complete